MKQNSSREHGFLEQLFEFLVQSYWFSKTTAKWRKILKCYSNKKEVAYDRNQKKKQTQEKKTQKMNYYNQIC